MEKDSREQAAWHWAASRLYEGEVPDHQQEDHHHEHPQHHDLPGGGEDQLRHAEHGGLRQGQEQQSEKEERIRAWDSERQENSFSLWKFISDPGFCVHLAGSAYKDYTKVRGDYLYKDGRGRNIKQDLNDIKCPMFRVQWWELLCEEMVE